MKVLRLLLVEAVCLAAGFQSAIAAAPPILTVEELFRPQFLSQAQLSPNGESLAAVSVNDQDIRSLAVFDVATKQASTLVGDDRFDLYSVRWLTNDQLLFNVSKDKIYSTGLYVANRTRLNSYYPIDLYDVTHIIGLPRARPNRALIWIVQSSLAQGAVNDLVEFSTVRSPVNGTGGVQRRDRVVHSFPSPKAGVVVGWAPDFDGELALCFTYEQGKTKLNRFQSAQQNWQSVPLDLDDYSVLHLDPDGHNLWVAHHDPAQGSVLQRYDLDTGQFEPPVCHDDHFDLGTAHLTFSRKDRKLVGLSYHQLRLRNIWFNPLFASVQAAVDHYDPACDNQLVDFDERENRFLFRSGSALQPDIYQLFDVEKKTDERIIQTAPWLKGRSFAETKSVGVKTRDGVTLQAYLTLPAGATQKHPVPLVVLAHGGPWVRDIWTFDPEVQFLASRGYAVLQPNYRGSTGFAPAISRERKFDFRRMHDDVTDATHALQKNGAIDSSRVAIMGGSFGGYLALAGAAFEPNLYRCAISVCGVFDWEELIRQKRSEGRPGEYEFLRDKIGHPGENTAQFENISPLAHVAQIRAPVLIAHGTEDRIVSVQQSKRLADALEQQGVPHETFFRSLEAHGFYAYDDRVAFYKVVEKFLAKNLGSNVAVATPKE